MKNLKLALLSILMTLPLMAFADHEEVLITFFIQAISIIIFLIVLVFIKLKGRQKAILAAVYIVAVILIWVVASMVPYDANMMTINIFVTFGPLFSVTMAYFLLVSRNNKESVNY